MADETPDKQPADDADDLTSPAPDHAREEEDVIRLSDDEGTIELASDADSPTTEAERDALLDEVDVIDDAPAQTAGATAAAAMGASTALPRSIDAAPKSPSRVVPLPPLDDNIASWEVLWLALVIIAAVLFRVAMIDQQALVTDELTTLISAERPFWESVTSFQDPQPPLYQVILRGLFEQYPASPWVLRGPAVVFGCIAVAIGWWSLRTLFGSTVAAISALLIAVNPTLIASSRESRAYSLFVLLTLLALTSFYRLVRTGSWVSFAAVVLFTALLPYSHYYGVFYLAMMLTYLAADWLLAGPSRQHGGRVVAAYIIALVLTVPAWVLLVRQAIANVPMAWWFPRPTAITAFDSLGDLLGIRALGVACVIPLIATVWLTRTYFDPAGKPAWINGRVRLTGWWRGRMHVLFVAMWVGFGLLLPVLISRVSKPVFLAEHAMPVIIPMVGLGLLFLSRSTRMGLACVVVVLVCWNLRAAWHEVQPRQGMPEVVSLLARSTELNDTIYVADWGRVDDFISPEVRGLQYYGLNRPNVKTLPIHLIEADPSGATVRLITDEPMTIVCYGSTSNSIVAHANALGLRATGKRFDQLSVIRVTPIPAD